MPQERVSNMVPRSSVATFAQAVYQFGVKMPTAEYWYKHNDWERIWWQPGPPPILMLNSPVSLCDVYSMMFADVTYKLLWFLDIKDTASVISVNGRFLGVMAVYAKKDVLRHGYKWVAPLTHF